jgi:GNAT superfamily N-acetyltransferase
VAPVVIEPDQQQAAELNAFLDDRIYEFNQQQTGYTDGRAFQSVLRSNSNEIIAAISGHTWGGCAHVVYFWVQELHRHKGFGRNLLAAVEAEAHLRGCSQVLVYTHSFQAPAFYEAMQYVKVATVANYPYGHSQIAYVKVLQRKPDS